MPKAGVRQSTARRAELDARDAADVEVDEDTLGELEEQADDALSPLAEYLRDPTEENAEKLIALASAGLLTLNDVQAALSQEIVNTVKLSKASADEIETGRMLRVQVARGLKLLADVVRKGKGGGPLIELSIVLPPELADDEGDAVPRGEQAVVAKPTDVDDELDDDALEEDDEDLDDDDEDA